MHVSFLSTYPPRACGLATFTRDLREGLLAARPDVSADVVSVVKDYAGPARQPEVPYELRQHVRADYLAAAEHLAASSADVLCVQHEFGIFGGPEGTYVLDLMDAARQPVVTTLHTVLPRPPEHYRRALEAVVARSARLVVMTETAARLLRDVYGADPARVRVVPHGAPARDPAPAPGLKARLGLEDHTVALTFGLLGPSKGIEFALDALPRAIEACPNLLYVVLGATHPEIVRREGERYREALHARVEAAGLGAHVRFVNQYVDTDALWDYLTASDVYVSPYPGMDQICSGTLAYALAAGKPVVSTPYLHAREVLAGGAGTLVPFGDTEAFGRALARFASDPAARAEAAARARAFGETTAWPRVGAAYAEIFAELLAEPPAAEPLPLHPAALPAAMDYLARLTDDTGLFQHAACGIPDRAHGYCADDAARALVVALAFARRTDDAEADALARRYLAFLKHAQRDDGTFANFLGFERRFLTPADRPDAESQDTTGRALWGLGTAAALAPDEPMRILARHLFERALDVPLTDPHALAYATLGLDAFLTRFPGTARARQRLAETADALLAAYDRTAATGWPWFHDALTYAVALLPHALLVAHRHLGAETLPSGQPAERLREVGLAALDFALHHTLGQGFFDPIGNRGWFPRGGQPARYDQQPIEAGYMADACATACALTGEARYAEAARHAVAWFYGRNRLGQALFDPATGACYDGFSPHGLNLNQGAESVVACLLGHLALERLDDLAHGSEAAREPAAATRRADHADRPARLGHALRS
ncbi:MAG: glycosyltransferase [Rubricoccaceae bacterium]